MIPYYKCCKAFNLVLIGLQETGMALKVPRNTATDADHCKCSFLGQRVEYLIKDTP